MEMDLNAAVTFLSTHGRILERRRMQLLLGEGTAEGRRYCCLMRRRRWRRRPKPDSG